MFLKKLILDKINYQEIFTSNLFGISRSLIAFSLLITLIFTESNIFFPDSFFNVSESRHSVIPNFFYLMGINNLDFAFLFAKLILIGVISGYFPQITGLFHAWISYSFFTGALLVEGGDQIGQIISILLVPVCLFDKRINHWNANSSLLNYTRPTWVSMFCYSCLFIVQIQMAIVYFFAVAEKIQVNEWVDGSAFYYWFNHRPFGASLEVRLLLQPLISNPYLSPIITWGVLVLEVLLFSSFFMQKEEKIFMFKLGVCFHLLIVIFHGLWSFFFAMLGGLVIYLLPWENSITIKFKLIPFFRKRNKKHMYFF